MTIGGPFCMKTKCTSPQCIIDYPAQIPYSTVAMSRF